MNQRKQNTSKNVTRFSFERSFNIFKTLSKNVECTYLLGWDHDTNLLNSLGELIRLDCSVTVQVEILEGPEDDCLLVLVTMGLLGKLSE